MNDGTVAYMQQLMRTATTNRDSAQRQEAAVTLVGFYGFCPGRRGRLSALSVP